MKIDLRRLEILKKKIVTATDFSKPMIYFFDYFADHRAFNDMCKRTTDRKLDRIIVEVGRKVFGKKNPRIKNKLFLAVPGYDVVHGPVVIEGQMMSFVYFRDIEMGAFSLQQGTSGQVIFGRLTAIAIKGKGPHFMMPPDKNIN